MKETNQSNALNSRKEQQEIQDAEIRETLRHIKNKILVMSGKGGVGKSSVAAYLSVTLAKNGYKVGLMDVDLHGPSIPRMLGLKGMPQPSFHPSKALPINYLPNMQVISIEPLLGEDKDVATIWRGPLKIGVIKQFLSDMEWPELDYLIIDSPPGTGDEPLTIAQVIPDAKALVVTTPQEISLADVRKSINFCRKVDMDILGVVENMSGLKCPHCGKDIELFKTRGGQIMAEQSGLRLLASLPFEPNVVKEGDMGSMASLEDDQLSFTREFNKMVGQIVELTAKEQRSPLREEEEASDKIVFAVPVAEGKLCAHFGHCEQFTLIETADGKIVGQSIHTPPPHEPGVLPKWLHGLGANIVIAGGMGSSAKDLFARKDIKVITGAPMDPPEALVNQYLSGILITGENACDH
jgi:Mrp family chromosome partitioning ATPase/predicted Fe-Mo cluster-binding NifX family protein